MSGTKAFGLDGDPAADPLNPTFPVDDLPQGVFGWYGLTPATVWASDSPSVTVGPTATYPLNVNGTDVGIIKYSNISVFTISWKFVDWLVVYHDGAAEFNESPHGFEQLKEGTVTWTASADEPGFQNPRPGLVGEPSFAPNIDTPRANLAAADSWDSKMDVTYPVIYVQTIKSASITPNSIGRGKLVTITVTLDAPAPAAAKASIYSDAFDRYPSIQLSQGDTVATVSLRISDTAALGAHTVVVAFSASTKTLSVNVLP